MKNRWTGSIGNSTVSIFVVGVVLLAIAITVLPNREHASGSAKIFNAQLAVFRGTEPVATGGGESTPRAQSLNNGIGWALTSSGLEVTTDNASTFETLTPPMPTSDISDVSIAGNQVTLASVANGIVTVATSTNLGSTWSTDPINPNQPNAASAQIVEEAGTVLGVFVTNQSNANFSSGDWFTVTSNGTWVENAAPVGGSVTYLKGNLWLVGGPIDTEVYVSSDDGSTWSTVSTPPSVSSSNSALAISGAINGSSVVLVATSSPETSIESIGEAVYTTDDEGASWNLLGTTSFPGDVGVGVPAPSQVVANEVWIGNPGGPQIVELSGLGVDSMIPVSVIGGEPAIGSVSAGTTTMTWATVFTTQCPTGKSSCAEVSSLYSMTDTGTAWSPVNFPSDSDS